MRNILGLTLTAWCYKMNSIRTADFHRARTNIRQAANPRIKCSTWPVAISRIVVSRKFRDAACTPKPGLHHFSTTATSKHAIILDWSTHGRTLESHFDEYELMSTTLMWLSLLASSNSCKRRSKWDTSLNTNTSIPAGHQRKIFGKLQISEKKRKGDPKLTSGTGVQQQKCLTNDSRTKWKWL